MVIKLIITGMDYKKIYLQYRIFFISKSTFTIRRNYHTIYLKTNKKKKLII